LRQNNAGAKSSLIRRRADRGAAPESDRFSMGTAYLSGGIFWLETECSGVLL
jgi:hypothetical protein